MPPPPASSYDQLCRAALGRLTGPEARREVEILLAAASGRRATWLRAFGDEEAPPAVRERFRALVDRRLRGEPIAYLLGEREFWSLPLAVGPTVLIPRPETETLVEWALARLPDDRPVHVADLGTGSGAIALALARERPLARVVATDRSAEALAVARANAERLALSGAIAFRVGDWYAALAGLPRFDLIASNPPYLAGDDPHLREGDLRFEPLQALVADDDGLAALARLAEGARDWLNPGGWMLVEHGHEQGAAVRALFARAGLVAVETARDLERRERITLGRAPAAEAGAA